MKHAKGIIDVDVAADFRNLQGNRPPPTRERKMSCILTLFYCCLFFSDRGDLGSRYVRPRFVSGQDRGSCRISAHNWGGDARLLMTPLRRLGMSDQGAVAKGNRAGKTMQWQRPRSCQLSYNTRHDERYSQRAH